MEKPFSAACERNRIPILRVLQDVVAKDAKILLEIGSGTGQHAVYLAPHFPHLIWVASDVQENHAGIRAWLEESGSPNIIGPGEFQVGTSDFPNGHFDLVFTANTLHIISEAEIETLFLRLGEVLNANARVCIYGPFNDNGQFTSESNAHFEQWLKSQNPLSGIRDAEWIGQLAQGIGLTLEADHAMPANNRLLVFRKTLETAA